MVNEAGAMTSATETKFSVGVVTGWPLKSGIPSADVGEPLPESQARGLSR